MSWNAPTSSWHKSEYDPTTWRPYANYTNVGVVRSTGHGTGPGPSRSGWNNWFGDPHFSRSTTAHHKAYMKSLERNRFHTFGASNQTYSLEFPKPITPTGPIQLNQINEFARQQLIKNAHVPGLKTGQQLRAEALKRKRTREKNGNGVKNIYGVKKLKVTVNVSSEKIDLRWEAIEFKGNLKYCITYTDLRRNISKTIERPPTSLFCELKVIAGEIYRVDIKCILINNSNILAHWENEIRAEFSYSELKQLYLKCLTFVTKTNEEYLMHEFCVVYRCKPKVYWDEIHHYCDDIMQKYIKDDNGQPANLINGKINGLFFSARLLPDLSLPPTSPFGNVRMIVDAIHLLHPKRHNYYFADFYCNKNIHYVTIVICVIDSETDLFCHDRLMKLNPLNNPFVKLIPPMDPYSSWRCYVNYSVWVEIYYTEDVELNMGQFSAIMATGAGTSRIGGLPNNKQCTICNLYPRKAVGVGRDCWEDYDDGVVRVENEVSEENVESTMALVLRLDKNTDTDVAETICDLVDRIEEQCMSAEELAAKLDPQLVAAVGKMNEEIANNKSLSGIAKNLADFVGNFSRRRDCMIEKLKKLKNRVT